MKKKLKFAPALLSFSATIVVAAFLPSCSDTAFKSDTGVPQRPSGDGSKSPLENGNTNRGGGSLTDPGFAAPGKSLDLYVIMDKSGSLYVDPVSRQMNTGSDVTCKRFDALIGMVDSLRSKLKSDDEVRLTIVTFSRNANLLGTMDRLLSQSSQQISSKFRAGVCDNPDYDTTNYERGISTTLQGHVTNVNIKKMDMESIVFFSDGAAKDMDAGMLEESIRRLNQTFPSRIYGVLLGKTRDQCVLKDSSGRSLQTNECMLKVVGNEPAKLLNVDDANGLAAAWSDLVNK